ncbi:hypothetical protein niasHT_015634 [Heterodera trifolii]|uniref:Uncharacterized protein n=1 Tax=Heterodera trifolii TaxID=157864 RepID=A0ABD2L4B5_9BILA
MLCFAISKCFPQSFDKLKSRSLSLIFIFLLTIHLLFAEIALEKSSKETFKNSLVQNSPKSDFNFLFQQRNTQKTAFIRHSYASSVANGQSRQHSRHRRRIPTGIIGKLIAKLSGKTGKIAATASKSDDIFVGTAKGKMKPKRVCLSHQFPIIAKVGRIPNRGTAPGRYYKSRGFDPPPFVSYAVPAGSEVAKRTRANALTGTKMALAAAGVGTGIWYFGAENAALYVAFIVGGVLIVLILALSLLFYLFLCRKRKKGYYAVNEQLASAFAKKVLFYLFC